ncbi:MAG TPA: putative lipopolysaccharide heptosyltransferase III [Accumulibacter sp.]|nr:putative lipopolysaccharide heptosyltransferase III [Accumulibacter sp.]HMW17533.1 putative lipopolysaccharide heptosyltransferase III [Accumulibacter sp.]HMX22903.1 putative lipopolysaccharide heptosyltransferase III [Accumulibacter sp.]HMY06140.1 putative lipopolysaccharide heptosyltransferase III [Accumulibacter sp.]HNC17611.1 putative lipopolysaccharide heptosyltransferase III [Accumulibacter sp.]
MGYSTVLRDAVPLDAVRRALVIKLRHHGDVLLSSPVFSVLKTHAPQVEIDALVYADTVEMLSLHPAISQVHGIDRQWKKLGVTAQARAELALFQTLKARTYDLVIHLTEHWRGAWLCRLLKPRWSVGPAVNGRGRRWRESFSHLQVAPRNALRHTVESNLDALRRIGIQARSDERRTSMIAGPAAEASVGRHLQNLGLTSGGFIHIHPASRWLFKCWTVDGMAGLIDRLQRQDWPVVLTAAPNDDETALVDAIRSRLEQPAHSLAGRLSLKELAALTQAARLFIGVDSAPMHIAAAVGTPVIALFGPSGDQQWGPWGVPVRVITSRRHPCRPCGIDGCGGGKISDCLTSLTVDDVWAAALELLAR